VSASVAPLSAHNIEIKHLRALLRDARERAVSKRCVLDSPRVIAGALDRGAAIDTVYLGSDASETARAVAERAQAAGARRAELAAGVATRIADVQASAGLLATVVMRAVDDAMCEHGDFWFVATQIADPGNLGTLIRSAEAAGAAGMIVGAGSVDVYNPKVVRASAGAVFGMPVLEAEVVESLERLGNRGLARLGAVAREGVALDDAPLDQPVVIVVGHETRGLGELPLDGLVNIPMSGPTESLNVAMAGSVLLFETARRRRVAGTSS
jgi:TrmH family RNA methyltransferase